MKVRQIVLLALSTLLLFSGNAIALTIGGIDFEDNAFADKLISSNPTTSVPFVYPIDSALYEDVFGIVGAASSIEEAVVGGNISNAAGNFAKDGYLELGFTDNYLVNGPGNDLALFELGHSIDPFGVSLEAGGVVIEYASAFTGYYTASAGIETPLPINVAFVDLNDFGIVDGALIDRFFIGGIESLTTLSVAGALNSSPAPVPEPSTAVLLGLGMASFVGFARKRTRK